MVGDSAGRQHGGVLTMMAAQSDLPSPAATADLAGLDMSLSNPQVYRPPSSIRGWLSLAGSSVPPLRRRLDRSDWRISPLYGDLSCAQDAAFDRHARHPASRLPGVRERAREAGVEVELFRRT